jgi:SWI/SNF-related matrix-associated actin-dependent regulator 1 of chromatin subfamily A
MMPDWANTLQAAHGLASTTITKRNQPVTAPGIYLASYELARSHSGLLRGAVKFGTPWSMVVLDECHHLKSPTSLQTKTLMPEVAKATHALLLSGTPMTKSV